MAPNYLAEEYAGVASYSEDDDDIKQTTCPVKVQFSPFHPDQPGLRICYSYKNLVCFFIEFVIFVFQLLFIFLSFAVETYNKNRRYLRNYFR